MPECRKAHLGRLSEFSVPLLLNALVQIDFIGFALTAAWGTFTGSWSPLIAVGIFSIPILTHALSFRYRAWQATTGRVYEQKAPFGDFMRDELRSLTGGRG